MTTVSQPNDAADYEDLRNRAQEIGFRRAAALLPLGLATWLAMTLPSAPRQMPRSAASSWPVLAMTRAAHLPALLASIVLRLAQEAAHA